MKIVELYFSIIASGDTRTKCKHDLKDFLFGDHDGPERRGFSQSYQDALELSEEN